MIAETHLFRTRALGVPSHVVDSFRDWHSLSSFLANYALSTVLAMRRNSSSSSSSPRDGPRSSVRLLHFRGEEDDDGDDDQRSSISSINIIVTSSPLVQRILRCVEHIGILVAQQRIVDIVKSLQQQRHPAGDAAVLLKFLVNEMRATPVLVPFSVLDPRSLQTAATSASLVDSSFSQNNNNNNNNKIQKQHQLVFLSNLRGTVVQMTPQLRAEQRIHLENSAGLLSSAQIRASTAIATNATDVSAAAASCLAPLRCVACKNFVNGSFLSDAGTALQDEFRRNDPSAAHQQQQQQNQRKLSPLYGAVPSSLWRIVSPGGGAATGRRGNNNNSLHQTIISSGRCPVCDDPGARFTTQEEAAAFADAQQFTLRAVLSTSADESSSSSSSSSSSLQYTPITVIALNSSSVRLGQKLVLSGHFCKETKLLLAHSFDDDANCEKQQQKREKEATQQNQHEQQQQQQHQTMINIVDVISRIVTPSSSSGKSNYDVDPLLKLLLACSCIWDRATPAANNGRKSSSPPLLVALVGPSGSGKRALLYEVHHAAVVADQYAEHFRHKSSSATAADEAEAILQEFHNQLSSSRSSSVLNSGSSRNASLTPQQAPSPIAAAGLFSLSQNHLQNHNTNNNQQPQFRVGPPSITASNAPSSSTTLHSSLLLNNNQHNRASSSSSTTATTTAFPHMESKDYIVPPSAGLSITAPRTTLVADGVVNTFIPMVLCEGASSSSSSSGGGSASSSSAASSSKKSLQQNLLCTTLAGSLPVWVQNQMSSSTAVGAALSNQSAAAAATTASSSASSSSRKSQRHLRVVAGSSNVNNTDHFSASFAPQDQHLASGAVRGSIPVEAPSILMAVEQSSSSSSPSSALSSFLSKTLRPLCLFWRVTRGGSQQQQQQQQQNGEYLRRLKLPSFSQLLVVARKRMRSLSISVELTAKLVKGVLETRRAHFQEEQNRGGGGGGGVAPLSDYMQLVTTLCRTVHALQIALDEFLLLPPQSSISRSTTTTTNTDVSENSAATALQLLVTALAPQSAAATSSSAAAAAFSNSTDTGGPRRRGRDDRSAGGGGRGGGSSSSVAATVRNLVSRVRQVQRDSPTGAVDCAIVEGWFQQCFAGGGAGRMQLDKAMQQGLLIRAKDGFKALSEF